MKIDFKIIIMIFLLNLKTIVIFFMEIMGIVVKMLIKSIVWIMQMFTPAGGRQEQGQGGGFPLNGGEVTAKNPVIEYILEILAGIFLLYAVYKLARKLALKVREAAYYILRRIRDLLKSTPGEKETVNEDYVDESETLKPPADEKRLLKRRIKGLSRSIHSIKDPVEKVRYVYRLIIFILVGRNVEIGTNDTTGEILRKSRSVTGREGNFEQITGIYDKVRYGDRIPEDREIADVERNYSELVEILKKNR